ncbi:MAG: M20 family metallopeptidase [Chloroflexi bacterium]|nr:M20 family metallopeptidase [Chloroflexota bacterium]MDA1146211.1 M20 family metallopeptidase [Chloroflexota bacterium]
MPDLEERRRLATNAIEDASPALRALSLDIHAHPELQFQEHHAHAVLTDLLEDRGFEVNRGAYGMDTAFRAVIGSGKPTVAVMCEYDALPGIGHACGHNLIAISGVAVGLALQAALEPGEGTIVVLGSPAEEGGGGKIRMIEEGAFASIDAAVMLHPGVEDCASPRTLAARQLDVRFHGKASHAAARPWDGINALDAMILGFNAVGLLRQQVEPSARIHGIITDGGKATNIIPDYSRAIFGVRAPTLAQRAALEPRLQACFEGAAEQTGARLEFRWGSQPYADLQSNPLLATGYEAHFRALGGDPVPERASGSTDMGNVSYEVPTLHPGFAVPSEIGTHNAGFTEAAATTVAHERTLRAATALAHTALDLYLVSGALAAARAGFDAMKAAQPA